MIGTKRAIGAVAAATVLFAATPVAAEVLDAVYRGTLICGKLPFTDMKMREAIEVTISGGAVTYSHVVRLRDAAEDVAEKGTGMLDGQNISLQGSWKSGNREYKAQYGGTFVRRSAKLIGAQTWTDGGRTLTRICSGAIKRPLKAFLPRDKKKKP